jgi:hypothetical protein
LSGRWRTASLPLSQESAIRGEFVETSRTHRSSAVLTVAAFALSALRDCCDGPITVEHLSHHAGKSGSRHCGPPHK